MGSNNSKTHQAQVAAQQDDELTTEDIKKYQKVLKKYK